MVWTTASKSLNAKGLFFGLFLLLSISLASATVYYQSDELQDESTGELFGKNFYSGDSRTWDAENTSYLDIYDDSSQNVIRFRDPGSTTYDTLRNFSHDNTDEIQYLSFNISFNGDELPGLISPLINIHSENASDYWTYMTYIQCAGTGNDDLKFIYMGGASRTIKTDGCKVTSDTEVIMEFNMTSNMVGAWYNGSKVQQTSWTMINSANNPESFTGIQFYAEKDFGTAEAYINSICATSNLSECFAVAGPVTSYNISLNAPADETSYLGSQNITFSFNTTGDWNTSQNLTCDLYMNDAYNTTQTFTPSHPLSFDPFQFLANTSDPGQNHYNWSVWNCSQGSNLGNATEYWDFNINSTHIEDSNLTGLIFNTSTSCSISTEITFLTQFSCTGNTNCTGDINLTLGTCSYVTGSDTAYELINGTLYNETVGISCPTATTYEMFMNVTNTGSEMYETGFNLTCTASTGGLTPDESDALLEIRDELVNMIWVIIVLALLVIGLWRPLPILVFFSGIGFFALTQILDLTQDNRWFFWIFILLGAFLLLWSFMMSKYRD